MKELRNDPNKYGKWLDRVINGWIMRKGRTRIKSSKRNLKTSKSH
jgi:hypothetical protein